MSKLASIFLIFVTLLAILVSLNGFLVQTTTPGQIFQILFIPITVYLFMSLAGHLTLRTPVFAPQNFLLKMVTVYCLIISSVFVAAGLMSSRTQADFMSTLVFSPLAIFFLVMLFPRRKFATVSPTRQPDLTSVESNDNIDQGRRDFLKMIGTAGISIFVYNLLFRRDSSLLLGGFGSGTNPLALKNAQGEVINPAEKSPTQGYYISQIDDETSTALYGFINSLGQWYIMRQDANNAYRYARGDKDFESNWANRAKLDYDYFDNVF